MECLQHRAERVAVFREEVLIAGGWLSYGRVAITPWLINHIDALTAFICTFVRYHTTLFARIEA